MNIERTTPDSNFRESLFNFYMGRQSAVENFKRFNKLVGGTGVILGAFVGDPVGWGLTLAAGTVTIINEVQMSKQIDSNSNEHQRVIRDVYEYKKNK